jgi:hypothetical protein
MHYTADRQGNCFFIFLGSQQGLYPRVGCIPCVVLVARVPKTAYWRSCPIFFLAEEAEFSHSRNKSCPLSLPLFQHIFELLRETYKLVFKEREVATPLATTPLLKFPLDSLGFPWLPPIPPLLWLPRASLAHALSFPSFP